MRKPGPFCILCHAAHGRAPRRSDPTTQPDKLKDPNVVEIVIRWDRVTNQITLPHVFPNKLEFFGLLDIGRQLAEKVYAKQAAQRNIVPARFTPNGHA